MGDTGIFRPAHQVWQRANVTAAATYLREQISHSPEDIRLKSLYDGLLDVLDPSRRTARVQRTLAAAAGPVKAGLERRARDRRSESDRRKLRVSLTKSSERRSGTDRRSGRDRRR